MMKEIRGSHPRNRPCPEGKVVEEGKAASNFTSSIGRQEGENTSGSRPKGKKSYIFTTPDWEEI